MKKRLTLDRYYPFWLMLPALVVFTVFFIIPNLASFGLAFTDWSLFFFDDIHFNGVANFQRLFSENTFWIAIRNTFVFAIVSVVIKNVLGFLLALMIKRTNRLNNFVRAAIFLPITISPIVVGIIFVAIYNPGHGIINEFLRFIGLGSLAHDWLFDTRFSLASIILMEVWQQTGFNMCIFIAGMQNISQEYYEAASLDGASYWQQVRCITLPLILQSFTVTIIMNLVSGIKVFAQVYGTTNGGPANATEVLSTFLYSNFGKGFLGYSAAVGLFMTLITIDFTFIILIIMRKREVEM